MNNHVHPIFKQILNSAKELLPTKASVAIRKAEKKTDLELEILCRAKLDQKAPERQEIVRSGNNIYVKIGGNK